MEAMNSKNSRQKIMVQRKRENAGAPLKNCSGPENENAPISLGKYSANAKEFSSVFEHATEHGAKYSQTVHGAGAWGWLIRCDTM